jgi:hypothetical protein
MRADINAQFLVRILFRLDQMSLKKLGVIDA